MITRITTTEEYWPGQKEGIATARIEVWTDDQKQHFPLEVGRITAGRRLFEELRDLIEGAIREGGEERDMSKTCSTCVHWERQWRRSGLCHLHQVNVFDTKHRIHKKRPPHTMKYDQCTFYCPYESKKSRKETNEQTT